MNASAPSAAAGPAPTTQTQATSAHARANSTRAAAGGDLFAQLLLLMGAEADGNSAPLATASDATALPGGQPDARAAAEAAQERQNPSARHPLDPLPDPALKPPQDNPLLGLLAWSSMAAPQPPQPQPTTPQTPGQSDTAHRSSLHIGVLVASPLGAATQAELGTASNFATGIGNPTATAAATAAASVTATASTAAMASALATATASASAATTASATAAATATATASATAAGAAVAEAAMASAHTARMPDLPALTTPETLDADARVALGLNSPASDANTSNARADTRSPAGAAPALGAQVTAWRSTTTLASATHSTAVASATTGPSTTTALAAAHSAATHRALATGTSTDQRAGPVQTATRWASTSERESATDADATLGLGSANGRTLVRGEAGATVPDAGAATASGQGGESSLGSDSAQTGSEPGDTGQPQPGSQADADDPASGGFWGAQHLRHASVRVGDAGEAGIDIQLSMVGQELQVAFRTDDEETRAQLAQDAGAALGELLERSGIELGSVSVGGQGARAGQDNPGRAPQPAPLHRTDSGAPRALADDAASHLAAPAPQRLRADGSRPLDLFV